MKELDALFPYESFNPGQKETIVKIISALKKGAKHVIVEAPTGVGKSAIAVTVHRFLGLIDNRAMSTIVTGTKALQDQYADEFKISDLRGRMNYGCNVTKGITYGSTSCKKAVTSGQCKDVYGCPYVSVRDQWVQRSDFRMTNSSFIIRAPAEMLTAQTTKGDSSTQLMIIDECHELPHAVIEHSTAKLAKSMIPTAAKKYGDSFTNLFDDLMEVISSIQLGSAFNLADVDKSRKVQAFYGKIVEVMASVKDRVQSGDISLYALYEELSELCSSISPLVIHASSEWILTELEPKVSCTIKPVYANQLAPIKVFNKANQFLHISATICGIDDYCESLGINRSEAVFISVDNPIPSEQRSTYLYTNICVNASTQPKSIASEIDAIISNRDSKENGIIHTVSFRLAQDIIGASKYKKRMIVSNDRAEIMRLMSIPRGSIIVSPSLETGYDFKGDMARWQIIAKVPYLYIGDMWVKLNMNRSESWYARQAIIRLIQASGRVVRGVSDFGDTYIIDGNATKLIHKWNDIIPEWYLDSLHIS